MTRPILQKHEKKFEDNGETAKELLNFMTKLTKCNQNKNGATGPWAIVVSIELNSLYIL